MWQNEELWVVLPGLAVLRHASHHKWLNTGLLVDTRTIQHFHGPWSSHPPPNPIKTSLSRRLHYMHSQFSSCTFKAFWINFPTHLSRFILYSSKIWHSTSLQISESIFHFYNWKSLCSIMTLSTYFCLILILQCDINVRTLVFVAHRNIKFNCFVMLRTDADLSTVIM